MTVHMFRVFIGKGEMATSDLETRIDEWVQSNPTWESDTVSHDLTERNTSVDGTGTTYYQAHVRFEQSDTKDNLLQKLTDKVKDKVAWYRVGYHSCGHDESDPSPCSWDEVVEWTEKDVTIPERVPGLKP